MKDVVEKIDIAPAWSAHLCGVPVLLTKGDRQFAAYYDETERLTAAQRSLGSRQWTLFQTGIQSDWNTSSHHAIALGIDRNGYIHVSGAMHNQPLRYYRSESPFDVASLRRIDSMTGENEQSVTYPQFFCDGNENLYATFRDGMSGNGNQYINRWDADRGQWHRMPMLTDGSASGASAYLHNSRPVLGPDGYLHVEFMWRASFHAESCFRLCYMRSKDMIHWEAADGTPLTLPVTPQTEQIIVDDVPQKSGLTNMMHMIGFDRENNAVITYHKYSDQNTSQLFHARFESGKWNIVQATDWKQYRWEFSGGGAIAHPFELSPVYPYRGELAMDIYAGEGGEKIIIDSRTLHTAGKEALTFPWDTKLNKPVSAFTHRPMTVEWVRDRTRTADGSYFLRWEHGPNNSDRALPEPYPNAEMLTLYRFRGNITWKAEIH